MLINCKHSGYIAGIRIYPGGGGKGGGSSAPPPDPRLVQAQIESMGYQNKAIQQMMDNNTEMQPLQKQQMQFGLDTSKTAYDQAQADRTYALGKRDQLSGLQDTALQQAKDFNVGNRGEQLATQAGETVQGQGLQAQGAINRQFAARGINAGSGAAMAAMNDNALNTNMNAARATNMARDAARQEGYQLSDRASNMLSGYPSMGMSATGAGAGYGTTGLGLANSALAGMNSGLSSASSAAGALGTNATGMYGAQASYKNSQDQIAAANDPFNTIVGAVAGGAGAYGMSKILGK